MTKRPFIITPESAGDVKKGLARASDGQWFHVSPRGDQVILRSLSGLTEEKHSRSVLGVARQGCNYVSYEVLHWYVKPGSEPLPGTVTHRAAAYWSDLAKRYEADPDLWAPPMVPPPSDLRKLYDELRAPGRPASAPSSAAHLAALFTSAVEHLASYRNLREGWAFEENRKPSDDETFARSVARQLRDGELVAPWEYRFVSRELAPLRTTLTGAPSSGAGGIDVLLVSDDDDPPLPIVVEVKSVKDVGAYLGLVQALTYASELITPHQLQRLARFHSDSFQPSQEARGPFADIWIVVERGKQDPEQAPTRDLAGQLLQETAVGTLLRRIAFLELDPKTRTLLPA